MNKIYVAWQDMASREWVPVAMLSRQGEGYVLQYTRGAKRSKNFVGFGRMGRFDQAYFSRSLFPFFENRLISKSRPEYKKYLNWLALTEVQGDPMSIMSVTGGVRMTDNFELIPTPRKVNDRLTLDFFSRGLNYLSPSMTKDIDLLRTGAQLHVLRDVQNEIDPTALLLRSPDPILLAGYIPRYYSFGISGLLNENPNDVVVRVKQINVEAPMNMRLLCTLSAPWRDDLQLLNDVDDFLPCDAETLVDASGLLSASFSVNSNA